MTLAVSLMVSMAGKFESKLKSIVNSSQARSTAAVLSCCDKEATSR